MNRLNKKLLVLSDAKDIPVLRASNAPVFFLKNAMNWRSSELSQRSGNTHGQALDALMGKSCVEMSLKVQTTQCEEPPHNAQLTAQTSTAYEY